MHGPLPQTSIVRRERLRGGDLPAVALLLLLVAVVARAPTFANPLVEYDEQFYLLVGDRMLDGALPYVDIWDRKPIGLFLIYALARLPGGDGFLAYKLLALGFLVLTALGVFRLARRIAGPFGAALAAMFFMIWHGYMGGSGGQAPVFYGLFMLAAALCVVAAIDRPRDLPRLGCAAMLAVGVAMQIKYSVLFEGVYLGCVLLWLAVRRGDPPAAVAGAACLWIGAALAPTALAFGAYAALGHGEAFVFANFVSALGQGRNPLPLQLLDLLEIAAILSPLFAVLLVGRRRGHLAGLGARGAFLVGWLLASLLGVLLYWRFNNPHYAIPVLLPLAILAAPVLDALRRRPAIAAALVGAALVASHAVLADLERRRGGSAEAMHAARLARPEAGCLYVYAGYPALYMLTQSCLPSRWAFPGSLNMRDEASARAVGVDPAHEVARIMAARPAVVVDEYPRSSSGNPASAAVLAAGLARDYALAACTPSGRDRALLVYRRREAGAGAAAPQDCPPVMVARAAARAPG